MAQIKFKVQSLAGQPIEGVSINLTVGLSTISKTTDANGEATVSGISADIVAMVSKENYVEQTVPVSVDNSSQVINKKVILLQPVKDVKDVATEKVVEEVAPVVQNVVKDVVDSFIFSEPTTFEDAKAQFKQLKQNIEEQQDVIKTALADSAIAVVEQQATNLCYTAKTQLDASMKWYVEQRSKLNPLGSWVQFRQWTEYTSMIAGIYILRDNLVKYMNALLEGIQEKLS